MWEHASTIVTIASFVLTAAAMLVGVTWRLAIVVVDLKAAIATARDEVEQRQDTIVREFGETVAAIRQKVHDVETWSRDEFVRKGSFEMVTARVERVVGEQFAKLETRLERMEAKIDSKT